MNDKKVPLQVLDLLILNMTILWFSMPIMQMLIMQTMRIRGIDIGIYCYR